MTSANNNGREWRHPRAPRPDEEVIDAIPDARDGLTRRERIVLQVLAETQAERGGRDVPMLQLYGRVIERLDMSKEELMDVVQRLMGRKFPPV